jgi:hypothetical protein
MSITAMTAAYSILLSIRATSSCENYEFLSFEKYF